MALTPPITSARPLPKTARTTLPLSCAAALLVLINYTVPAVTLPETAAALGAGTTGPAWMLNGIALGLAALLLVAGGVADDFGRKRVYLTGMIVLAIASGAAAVAPNTLIFVIARLVQGGASAALLAAGLGAVGHAYPTGPERLRATGLYGSMLGLGIAIGPLVAAGVAAAAGWRIIYLTVGAAAVVLAVLAARLLPESRSAERRRLDFPGVITLSLGVAALIAGVTQGRQSWTSPVVPVAFGAALLLLGAFVLIEKRRREPLLDLHLFRRPLFAVATGGALVTGIAVIGIMTYLPTVLQLSRGMSPLGTAVLFCVWSGMAFATALQSRRLRLRTRTQLALGLLLSAAGSLPLLGVASHWSAPRVVAGLIVGGVGSGLINSTLTHLAIGSVPHARAGMGAGANNTARYVGSALGVSGTTAIIGARGLADGTDTALIACAILATLAALAVLLVREES